MMIHHATDQDGRRWTIEKDGPWWIADVQTETVNTTHHTTTLAKARRWVREFSNTKFQQMLKATEEA